MASKVDNKEIEIIRNKLAKLSKGDLPLPVFLELTRLCVFATLEIAPFKLTKNNSLQVLLIKRKASDPSWPGLYHAPGTIFRAWDKERTFQDAFKRIFNNELKGVKLEKGPIFVKPVFRSLGRGKEITLMHWALVKENCPAGKYFNIDSLPDNIIKKQVKDIRIAVNHFKKYNLKA